MRISLTPLTKNPRLLAPPRYVRSFFVNGVKEMRIRFDPVQVA